MKPPPDAALTVIDRRETPTGNQYLVEWYTFGVRCEAWVREEDLEAVEST
jgi:hypothetical protein